MVVLKVLNSDNLEEASAIFSGIFGTILNKYAPLKVIQVRNNYAPWISNETKQLQKTRDLLKKESIQEQSNEKFEQYKKLRNYIVKRLKSDRLQYYKTKFYGSNLSTSAVWKQANDYLNTANRSVSSTPNLILHNGKVHTSPRDIANAINEAFIAKVDKLCEKVTDTAKVCPLRRLNSFLSKKVKPVEQFELNPIGKPELRKILETQGK